MLDFFRKHKILTMLVLMVGIVPGLGFIGVQSFRDIFDESANIVSVNGHKISHADFDQEMQRQTYTARDVLGSKFDLKTFDTPQRRQQVLDGMINQQLLNDEVKRLYLSASDDAVRRAIMSQTWVAALKNPDGTINLNAYRQVLAQQTHMTPEQYDDSMRFHLASQQLPDAITASAFVPKSLVQHLVGLYGQTRDVQGLGLNVQTYAPKVQPTDAQVQAYYDAHHKDFATPATAQIQYLVLSPQVIAASFQPSEADLQQFYKANIASYSTPEQVRMSHILIVPQSASAADRDAAKHKAGAILAEIRAHPDQFAQIAQKDSQDTDSAAKGGDLGYFSRGAIPGGNAFNDAVFKLKKGETSGVLQSDFGYHIVMLTDVKPATTQPFDQVKESIVQSMKAQQVPALISSESDGFATMVHEQPKSLQPIADKYRLTIQTATVTPVPNPALPANSPLNNAKFLANVFASDSVLKHNSTEAIDVGNSTQIAAHVTSYTPAAVPAFAQVKDTARQKLIAQEAADLARKDGQTMLAALQKSKSVEGFSPVLKVSRTNPQNLPPDALSAIYKVDPQHLPAYVGVDMGNAGYAIYRVSAVDNGAPLDANQMSALQQQFAQSSAQVQSQAYYDALRARAKIKFYGAASATGNGAGLTTQ